MRGRSPGGIATRQGPGLAVVVDYGLILGSIPLFIGLVVILPVLGHATWHLYRKLIAKYPAIPFDTVR